jgi:hypothetical protein
MKAAVCLLLVLGALAIFSSPLAGKPAESDDPQRSTSMVRVGTEELTERARLGVLWTVCPDGGQPHVFLVRRGLPAERAGIKKGDRIVKVNGRTLDLRDDVEMLDYFGQFKAGERLQLQIERDLEMLDVELVAEAMPLRVAQGLSQKREETAQRIAAGLDPCQSCPLPPARQGDAFRELLKGWAQEAPDNRISAIVEQKSDWFLVRVPVHGIERQFGFEELPMWQPDVTRQLAEGETITIDVYSKDGYTSYRKAEK